MNKTKNIHNQTKTKLIVASIAIVVALALFASPIVAMDDAFATKKNGKVTASQSISQSQASVQNALCASGGTTFLSCNNVNFQNQKNSGNNALAQDDDDDYNGGNFAEQSISQSQSSEPKQSGSIRCRYNRLW